jgi:hypothetical protein
VVAVSDRVYEPRPLRLTDDAEEFLRTWVREIGLRTGTTDPLRRWADDHRAGGLVVTVSDQPQVPGPAGARHCQVRLAPPGDGAAQTRRAGTVVLAEGRPDAVQVVRALAHASPAA